MTNTLFIPKEDHDWLEIHFQWSQDLENLEILAVGEHKGDAITATRQISRKELGLPENG